MCYLESCEVPLSFYEGPKHVVPGATGTINLLVQVTGAQGGLETVLLSRLETLHSVVPPGLRHLCGSPWGLRAEHSLLLHLAVGHIGLFAL